MVFLLGRFWKVKGPGIIVVVPGSAIRMQKEKVLLPSEDQYKVPSEFREEILDAMKKQTPKNYEQLVNEYYRELVQ